MGIENKAGLLPFEDVQKNWSDSMAHVLLAACNAGLVENQISKAEEDKLISTLIYGGEDLDIMRAELRTWLEKR